MCGIPQNPSPASQKLLSLFSYLSNGHNGSLCLTGMLGDKKENRFENQESWKMLIKMGVYCHEELPLAFRPASIPSTIKQGGPLG